MAKSWNQNASIRGALRRMFARSPVVREVLMKVRRTVPKFNSDGNRSKKDAVQYHCSVCSEWVKSTAVSVDHITPVICVDDGFVDWNVFISRLFCEPDNLQVICDTCHQEKTNAERAERLRAKYSLALSIFENTPLNPAEVKAVIKELNKIVKSKASGVEDVVERARVFQNQLKSLSSSSKPYPASST
jgi:hypothetical protein